MNYYNEFDKFASQWLRNFIAAGILPDGDVDDRPIQEVQPNELKGYTQCHFFAGIGGWSLALRLAGWANDRPVWTGSCPCQPFSTAGKNEGVEDERHLWPEFYRLIKVCKPDTVFGEQVEGAVKHGWLDGVSADLEAEGYAVGSVVLGAHSVGAPHIRQRLWWVADAGNLSSERNARDVSGAKEEGYIERFKNGCLRVGHSNGSDDGEVADRIGKQDNPSNTQGLHAKSGEGRNAGGVADCNGQRLKEQSLPEPIQTRHKSFKRNSDNGGVEVSGGLGRRGRGNGVYGREDGTLQVERPRGLGFWAESIIIPFLDGKERRIKPGLMPLVDGFPGRVGQIRAYGNAIIPSVAAEFIRAYMESLNG